MWSRFLLALTILTAVEGLAQTYPSKPVRIVVPSSPGGASDLVTRVVSTALGERLGQAFVVENRVTSGGIIGTQQVAESAPDGYTLLGTFDTFAVNPYLFKGLKWDPVRDFAPLMQVCRYPAGAARASEPRREDGGGVRRARRSRRARA
jgi:tripartite-type tricarboxylate transporter receptor subunit TctC